MSHLTLKNKLYAVLENQLKRFLISNTHEFIDNLEYQQNRLFFDTLLPLEIIKAAFLQKKFQEFFSDIWEKLIAVAIEQSSGTYIKQHTIRGTIKVGRLQRIQAILSQLEHSEVGIECQKPNWNAELTYILKGKGAPLPVSVVCDFYTEDVQTGERVAFICKPPFPNRNQAKQSKEDILKLFTMDSKAVDIAYFALPFNPYGNKVDYAWTYPNIWFDMRQDEVVLIGAEFWDKIGGVGTYAAFIEAINEIGLPYKERIYREFLGIEPLEQASKSIF
jgi:hypothetical protein